MAAKEEDEQRVREDDEPQISYKGIKVMPFIIGNEAFEKLGTFGMMSNLLVYLTTVFNMPSITATTLLNVFDGSINFATLLGAFLCDTYFGRHLTLGFACIASFTGLFLVDLTAVFKQLHPPECGSKQESGKRGITSFFNWYLFAVVFAQMVSLTVVVYIQSDLSWPIGLAIPVIFMFISCVLFFSGNKMYVKVKPDGSPFTSMARVLVVAVKKRRLKLPEQPQLSLYSYTPPKSINLALPYSNKYRFLNKAAIVTPKDRFNPDGSTSDPWNLCSIQQVEEFKCVIKAGPIWIGVITYFMVMIQQMQYAVFQALQSNRRLFNTNIQIPAASYNIFTMLTIVIFVPIYDRLIVPQLRRITVSALVEEKRRNLAFTEPTLGYQPHRGEISSMSALWLIPQLCFAGLAESFTAIGLQEFYYRQFPENMRSVAGAFFFSGLAVSSYLNGLLVTIIHRTTKGAATGNWLPEDLNKGRLDYFHFLMTCIGIMNLGYFLLFSSWYRYKETNCSRDGGAMMEMEKKLDKSLV
ncbi:unnamed protein product [Lactuca virosa]|uniref:Uncharacterized protein n=1 Tax=Lactuca virosa TaxID=75947 RepID=A0AAU9P193_9ASTR|nr:unnamed protein product [Lactuca virosa]